jgi:tetratricopeptide (TPR) repeat protein
LSNRRTAPRAAAAAAAAAAEQLPEQHAAPARRHARRDLVLAALLIGAITLIVYGRAVGFEFVSFDDPLYLEQCPQIKPGLSAAGISWAFTGEHLCNWHPLTTLTYLAEYQFAGFKPWVYHLDNVILHVADAVLLLVILSQMSGGAIWRSALVAALFALHPLHVESVAWVSERKDVLSMLFFLLTLAAYMRYVRRGGWKGYLLVAVTLACGLMSKPMLVTLPLVLLLLDCWPLKRQARWTKLVLEKAPLLAMSAASSVVTFLIQRECGAVATFEGVPLSLRLSNVAVAYCTYLLKMLWPTRLAAFYPFNADTQTWPLALAALCAITLLALWQFRRRPYLAVGWAWYLIMLVPVIGLVQVGEQMIADRYTYIPLIGVFIIVAWGGWELLARLPRARAIAMMTSAAVVGALSIVTYVQAGYWRNTETLFAHAARVVPNNHNAHLALGDAYAHRHESDRALAEYLEGARIKPFSYEAQSRLAVLYMERKEYANAEMAIGKAVVVLRQLRAGRHLEHDPRYVETQYNLGVIRMQQDDIAAATPLIEQAARNDPQRATYVAAVALLRNKQARHDEAAAEARRAIELDGNDVSAWGALATASIDLGKLEDAAHAFDELLRLTPDDMAARLELSGVLARLNRRDEAMKQLEEAVRRAPTQPLPHFRLGVLLQVGGRLEEASAQYRQAIALDPQSAARNNLAWILATARDANLRNGAEAVRLAESVRAQLKTESPETLDTLAAAYVEAGEFSKAVETAREAIALADSAGNTKLAEAIRQRLSLYEKNQPYRE